MKFPAHNNQHETSLTVILEGRGLNKLHFCAGRVVPAASDAVCVQLLRTGRRRTYRSVGCADVRTRS